MLRQLARKQEETTRSVEKIEKRKSNHLIHVTRELTRAMDIGQSPVCYALRLRLLEFAERPDILQQLAKRALGDARDQEGPSKEE